MLRAALALCVAQTTKQGSNMCSSSDASREARNMPRNERPSLEIEQTAEQQTSHGKKAGAIRPHIIMAIFDDAGANDFGSYSGGVHTPRMPFMDELMAGGIKLKQYYVQPICSPTRSALMTGRYPMRTGGQHGVAMASDPTWIPEDEILLPQRLAFVGYRCVGTGKWYLTPPHAHIHHPHK